MADKYGPTKTQKKESKQAGAVVGGLYGGIAGATAGRLAYGNPEYKTRNTAWFGGAFDEPARGAHKWRDSAKAKTSQRPNPKFNTKRWEKVDNLYQRTTGGERAAAGAAKERMLAAGEGPYLKGSKNPFFRAMAHEHSPKVAAGAIGLATGAAVGTGLYHGTKKLAESGYRNENKIAAERAERKSAMSKSAFGVDHEEVAKRWNNTKKTQGQNVGHGAKKGAAIGGAAGATGGAAYGGAVARTAVNMARQEGAHIPKGKVGAVTTGAMLGGAASLGVQGALTGAGVGAAHGALRSNKSSFAKALDLKPLVFNSNGHIVGGFQGKGEQRDPKAGPFGVPKGPEVKLKQKLNSNTIDASTDLKPSGVQGRGKGKRDPQQGGIQGNKIAKAFTEPLSDEELAEIYKGLGAAMKAVGGAAKSFGIGAANRGVGAYGMAKPKIGAGLKLAAANPGKTALATAGVGGAAGFGIGRKSS